MPASPADLAEVALRAVGLLAAAALVVGLVVREVEQLGTRSSRYVSRTALRRRRAWINASAVVFAVACLLQLAVLL